VNYHVREIMQFIDARPMQGSDITREFLVISKGQVKTLFNND
jgi:hypothetical protein